jgi:hypothetical protein
MMNSHPSQCIWEHDVWQPSSEAVFCQWYETVLKPNASNAAIVDAMDSIIDCTYMNLTFPQYGDGTLSQQTMHALTRTYYEGYALHYAAQSCISDCFPHLPPHEIETNVDPFVFYYEDESKFVLNEYSLGRSCDSGNAGAESFLGICIEMACPLATPNLQQQCKLSSGDSTDLPARISYNASCLVSTADCPNCNRLIYHAQGLKDPATGEFTFKDKGIPLTEVLCTIHHTPCTIHHAPCTMQY